MAGSLRGSGIAGNSILPPHVFLWPGRFCGSCMPAPSCQYAPGFHPAEYLLVSFSRKFVFLWLASRYFLKSPTTNHVVYCLIIRACHGCLDCHLNPCHINDMDLLVLLVAMICLGSFIATCVRSETVQEVGNFLDDGARGLASCTSRRAGLCQKLTTQPLPKRW